MMRLQLLVPLLAGGVVVIVAFGYGLAWLLLHDADRLIDLGDLTEDRDGATVEETLQRVERLQVDPSKLSTAEIQRAHRTLAQDMATRPAGLYVPRAWGGER